MRRRDNKIMDVNGKWHKLKQLYWGSPPNKRTQKILSQLHKMWKKGHQAKKRYVTLEKAYYLMTQEHMLAQAADYIVHFGVCGLAYCCGYCKELPTNPKMWGRAFFGRPASTSEATEREVAESAHDRNLSTTRAAWYCPNDTCARRYSRGLPCNRVFFAIDIAMLQAMKMQNIEANINALPVTNVQD